MGLLHALFLFYTSAFSLSGFDFIKKDKPSFNKVFLKRQINWGVNNYLPALSTNKEFQSELLNFIENEASSLFLELNLSPVKLPKYFFRAQVVNSKASNFEIGFIFTNETGSVWTNQGKVKETQLFSNKQKVPSSCKTLPETDLTHAYYRYNKKTFECSRFSVQPSPGHPLYIYSLKEHTSDGSTAVYLSAKQLYPGLIVHGTPAVYSSLAKAWRLNISRFTNKTDRSIIYFP